VLSASSFRSTLAPLATLVGERVATWLGVSEPLAVRLRRVHATIDPTAFRLRQFAWAGASLAVASLACSALRPPMAGAVAISLGSAALAFLVIEQQLATASSRRKTRILLELPVVSEQLGMLMGAGYSLGSALNRMAERGSGACAEDLSVACGRVRQGLTEVEALREWAEVADVDALTRLVSILSLNRETSDLGRLVADEARSIRREVQRELVEQIERRSQQVWIPVTVATLVPGTVLLAVPFLEALRLFSNS
jgi:Flp pilus assembly protein TadB